MFSHNNFVIRYGIKRIEGQNEKKNKHFILGCISASFATEIEG